MYGTGADRFHSACTVFLQHTNNSVKSFLLIFKQLIVSKTLQMYEFPVIVSFSVSEFIYSLDFTGVLLKFGTTKLRMIHLLNHGNC